MRVKPNRGHMTTPLPPLPGEPGPAPQKLQREREEADGGGEGAEPEADGGAGGQQGGNLRVPAGVGEENILREAADSSRLSSVGSSSG